LTSPEAIPDAALLQSKDLNGAVFEPVTTSFDLAPPQPCAEPGYPSDDQRRAERAAVATYRRPGLPADYVPTTRIFEYVAAYRPGGSVAFFGELADAIVRCPGIAGQQHERRWTVTARGVAGDQSMLVRIGCECVPASGSAAFPIYAAVVRIGSTVVVLVDQGWETGAGSDEFVRAVLPIAVRRASALP
jgi:hypothetical protein